MLINWALAKRSLQSFPASAVLLGAVAPDIPLYFLSFGGFAWFRWVEHRDWPDIGQHMYGYLFYNDPWWITLHNALHSPLVLAVALLGLFALKGRAAFLQSWWVWFFASCMLHTLIDIPVHYDDGPLVLWPLNWSYRVSSPISYWDPNHFGRVLMPLEALLALTLLIRLVWDRYRLKSSSSE